MAPSPTPTSTSTSTVQETGERRSSAKAALAAVEERAVGGRQGSADRGSRTSSVGASREKEKEKERVRVGGGVRARNVDKGLLKESLEELEVG